MSSSICAKTIELCVSDFLTDDVIKKIGDVKIVLIQDAFESIEQISKFLSKKVSKYLKDVIIFACSLSKIQNYDKLNSFKLRYDSPQIINITSHTTLNSWIYYRDQSTGQCIPLKRTNDEVSYDSFQSTINHFLRNSETSNLLNIRINTNQNFNGKRLIDYAVIKSDILYIKFLLLFDVNLEIANLERWRPLEIAVKRNHKATFFALLDLNIMKSLSMLKDNKIIKLMSLKQEGTNLNLLMLAVLYGFKEILNFLLKHQFFDINYCVDGFSAAFMALGRNDFKTLYLLLQHNSKIPSNLDVNDVRLPKFIKTFVNETVKIHDDITKINNQRNVKEIIQKYPNLRHFYNLEGKSAVATAIEHQSIEIYELLISNGITLSKDEDIQTLIHRDDESFQRIVRDANKKQFKIPYEAHITRLLEHSRVGHDVPDSLKQKYSQLILDAVRQLSSAQEIDILFQVVTTSDLLRVIFEFNHATVDQIDPTKDKFMLGTTYLSGWIYIGTKGLKAGKTEEEKFTTLGTIAHEICHFAMQMTYENLAKPYKEDDSEKKAEFQALVKEYESLFDEKDLEEEIISRVFKCYEESLWSAELIVRIPEICAFYMKKPEKLILLKQKHHKLFAYYYQVMEDMKKLVSGYSATKTIKLINDVLGVQQEILKASKKAILRTNFKHPVIDHYSNFKAIKSNCPILTAKHIIERLDPQTTILVKNESLKIDKICELVEEVFSQDNIKPKLVVLCDNDISNLEVNNLTETYKENLIFILNNELELDEILTNHVEYKFNDLTTKSKNQFSDNIIIFQGMEVRLDEVFFDSSANVELPLRQLLNKEKIIVGKIPQKPAKFYFKRELEKDSENSKSFHDIINEKILLLSDEPGMGKSTTFKNAALQIKQEFPLRWVLYVDLKLYFASYKKFKNVEHWTTEGIVDLFAHMLKFNKLDRAAFNAKLCSKEATLLFDGVDEISPDYKEFIIKLIHQVHTLTSNQLWIASRPHCVREIKDILKIKCYKLSTIDQDKFIEFFFKETQTCSEEQKIISKCIEKMRADWNEEYNNPLLIMIAIQIHKELDGEDNLYTFYEKFVNKKFKIIMRDQYNLFEENLGKGDLREDDLIEIRGKVDHFHEKMAINLLLKKIQNHKFKFTKLEIFKICNSDVGIDAIFGMGILYGDSYEHCFFVHLTLAEFFTSKFLVRNVIESISCDEEEKKLRLEFFWTVLVDENNKQIQRFIEYYLQKNTVNTKNLAVCAHFNAKIEEQCDKFKDTLEDISLEDSKCYFFHQIFMHLVVYKFDKTMKFLRKVCKIDDTKISVSHQLSSSLHAVNWHFTLNFFGQELGKKMLITFMSSNDSVNSQMKFSTFSNAINNFYGENLSNFFLVLNETFNSSELNQIIVENNDQKSSVFNYIDMMMSSTSKSVEDFKTFLNFIDRNFNEEIGNAIMIVSNHFNKNVEIFAQLISSCKNPSTIDSLREIIFGYIGSFEKTSELIAIWNKDFLHMLNGKDYRTELLKFFFECLHKISDHNFTRPNVSYDWLLSDKLDENTKLLKTVVNNSEMAIILNYDERTFLNDLRIDVSELLNEYIKTYSINHRAGNRVQIYGNLFKYLLEVLPELNDLLIQSFTDFAKENQENLHTKLKIIWTIAETLNHSSQVKILIELLTNIQEINLELFYLFWDILKKFLKEKSLITMFLFLKKDTKEYPVINLVLKNVEPKKFSEFMVCCGHMIQYKSLETIFKCTNFSFFDLLPSEKTLIENYSNLLYFLKSKFKEIDNENRLLALVRDFIKTKVSDKESVSLIFLKCAVNASILSEKTVKSFFGYFLNDISIMNIIATFYETTKTIDIYNELKKNILSNMKGENLGYLSENDIKNVIKVDLTILYQRMDYTIYESLTKGLFEGKKLESLITKIIKKNKIIRFIISGSDEDCGWNKIQQSVLQQVKSTNFKLNFLDEFKEIDIQTALMQPNRKLNGRTLLMEILQDGIDTGKSIKDEICYVLSFMPLINQERFLLQPDLSGKNALQMLTSIFNKEDHEYLKSLLPQSSTS